MGHKTYQELERALKKAANKVEIGGLYYHYKNSVHPYKVIDLVIVEATNEVAVLYTSSEVKTVKFVRPLSSWLDLVELDGQYIPRFKKQSLNPNH